MTQLEIELTHSEPSQATKILEYLKRGLKLTPKEARQMFGCDRLGARIWELKKAHSIKTTLINVGNGKRVAQYSLEV